MSRESCHNVTCSSSDCNTESLNDCVTLINGASDGVCIGIREQCRRSMWQAYTDEWASPWDADVSYVYPWWCCASRDPGGSASGLHYSRITCFADEHAPHDASKHVSWWCCDDGLCSIMSYEDMSLSTNWLCLILAWWWLDLLCTWLDHFVRKVK